MHPPHGDEFRSSFDFLSFESYELKTKALDDSGACAPTEMASPPGDELRSLIRNTHQRFERNVKEKLLITQELVRTVDLTLTLRYFV